MPSPSRETIDMLARLIGFETVSRNSNLDLIEFVRDYLSELGVESRLIFGEGGRKANLFATLGPADRPGVVLSGHSDVVPVDGQDWSSDPFSLVERDERLFGRGTADMKSFIAVALALAPEFLSRGLKRPIHLAVSYDEEVGCLGVRGLLDDLAGLEPKPAACIVGEPTEMAVVVGHKGKKSFHCEVIGHSCHSSLAPQGVNAVEIAAEIVAYLRHMGKRFREEGPLNEAFEPPHSTAHTGVIGGGTALNIVPSSCAFEFEFRTLPTHDPDALFDEVRRFAEERLIPEMRAVAPRSGIEFEQLAGFPGLDTPETAEVVELAKSLTGANATGKLSFGTEGGLFHQAGIPTVICGPGSIDQAHKPDEFVALDQVARCEAFMRRLADRLASA